MSTDMLAAIAAWAGFAATVAAGLYTRSQARSARSTLQETREAREAAQDQAVSARESAVAAHTSAAAAVDSARSAREANEIARKAYDRDDEPTFQITLIPSALDGKIGAKATRMLDGPPEIWVKATWRAIALSPSNNPAMPNLVATAGAEDVPYLIARGEDYVFLIAARPTAYKVKASIQLISYDAADESRRWQSPYVEEWVADEVAPDPS
jgi:hypothetical protein